jgi:catechol 2,3-dioxygenase-like lactoylglutathione lyase family enzyme
MIWTVNLQQSIEFYVTKLGFTLGDYNEEWGWAALIKGECELMVARPNEHTAFETPVFTGTFYIKTDAVDILWEGIKDTVDICYEIENFDWGMREFAIYDNNGYMIQFGQDISDQLN